MGMERGETRGALPGNASRRIWPGRQVQKQSSRFMIAAIFRFRIKIGDEAGLFPKKRIRQNHYTRKNNN
jgi:hypothetical protein